MQVVSDDGVRVWIDGQLVLDDWTGHTATSYTQEVSVRVGTPVPVRVEYFNALAVADLRMSFWSGPATGVRDPIAGPGNLPPPLPAPSPPVSLVGTDALMFGIAKMPGIGTIVSTDTSLVRLGSLRVVLNSPMLNKPRGLAINGSKLYVANSGDGNILEINLQPYIANPANLIALPLNPQVVATGLTNPDHVTVDAAGVIYASDLNGVVKIDAGIVKPLLTNAAAHAYDGAPTADYKIGRASGLAVDGDTLYVAQTVLDNGTTSAHILAVSLSGGSVRQIINTVNVFSYSVPSSTLVPQALRFDEDGRFGEMSRLLDPQEIAVNPITHDLIFSDNGSGVIRRRDAITGQIQTIAGTGFVNTTPTAGTGALQNTLVNPTGIASDGTNTVFTQPASATTGTAWIF
jgi:PA14 domain